MVLEGVIMCIKGSEGYGLRNIGTEELQWLCNVLKWLDCTTLLCMFLVRVGHTRDSGEIFGRREGHQEFL